MRIFEPHAHMISRTTDDYERMALAGIEVIVEPAFWIGEPRKHVGTFLDYFDHICNFEPTRAAQYGIQHFCMIALNPREANRVELAARVIEEIPRYLDHPRVLGVGEIGFDDITDAEEEAIRAQLELAKERGCPVLIHTPHRHKEEGTERTLRLLREVGNDPGLVLIDHNTEETIGAARAYGGWCGHTVYPVTKLSPVRMATILEEHGVERMLVNGAPDWGPSDPLSVSRTVQELRQRDFPREGIQKVFWENPVEYFSRSGKLPATL